MIQWNGTDTQKICFELNGNIRVVKYLGSLKIYMIYL